MSIILPVNNIFPTIPQSVFVAPNATIVGDVQMGEECSIWFNAVIRGDCNYIRIGKRTNVQDNPLFMSLTLTSPPLLGMTLQ